MGEAPGCQARVVPMEEDDALLIRRHVVGSGGVMAEERRGNRARRESEERLLHAHSANRQVRIATPRRHNKQALCRARLKS